MSVKLAVIEALDLDPDVNAAAVGVLVDTGCVTLTGDAGSEGRRRLARETAFAVVGARVVVDGMQCNGGVTDDGTLREHRRAGVRLGRLLQKLADSDPLPVRATIVDGRISLHGRLPNVTLAHEWVEILRQDLELPLDDRDVVAP